jgi:hypothetical protein
VEVEAQVTQPLVRQLTGAVVVEQAKAQGLLGLLTRAGVALVRLVQVSPKLVALEVPVL